ncbi:MAG TPA: dTDP-4-dehydrorhamnose reductase [Ramlibacter sp.]|nr:dTDP-4-dehydrorhamnose reductase [Ramlibacter sp.]
MKILLFGKNGQLGWELQRSLAPLGALVALDSRAGDLADLDGLARTVAAERPAVVVNAAAFTAVDRAESEPERARLLNALAPRALAQACDRAGAWLVHYSSDYVFDGSGSRPWTEDDTPAPLNVYGATKREGEQGVAAACARHLILRTSWVYAARGANFARTMLRLAAERTALDVVDDQVGAPTGAELAADVTAHALRLALDAPALAGTYHLAAGGETSWCGYARFVIGQAQAAGMALQAGPDAVRAVASSAFATAARRPLNSRLATAKLQRAFGLQLPQWQQPLARTLTEMIQPS